MIQFAVASLCALAAWLVVRTAAGFDGQTALRLAELRPSGQAVNGSGYSRAALGILAAVGSRLPLGKAEIRSRLVAAGAAAVTAEMVVGAQVLGAIVGLLVGLRFGAFALVAAPALAFAGFRLPIFVVSMKVKARREDVAAALPDAVDLLAVCTQAGLNITLSLQRVAAHSAGLLGAELGRVVEAIDLGVPKKQALESLAARTQVEDLAALVATLNNAERFGTQVAASLEGFSAEVRQKRRRRSEEQARRAPVKILFPMIFLILPAFLVLTVLPLLLGALQNLSF